MRLLATALKNEALVMLAQEYPGHAVLDSGATESIASFEALEEILQLRALHFGAEELVVHQQRKKFKFGNGESQHAASLKELPQVVAGQTIHLAVHTIDAPGIPLLLSVKTLTGMKAVIDFDQGALCFQVCFTAAVDSFEACTKWAPSARPHTRLVWRRSTSFA